MIKIIVLVIVIMIICIGCVTYEPYSGQSLIDISKIYIMEIGNPDCTKTYMINKQHAVDMIWDDINLTITFINDYNGNDYNGYESWKIIEKK